MKKSIVAALAALSLPCAAQAVTTPAPGYLYVREVLAELTEGCIAHAPGGVFVGVGPALSFPAPGATRDILFVPENSPAYVVATGLNSIGDCVYDSGSDTLYVTDSGAEFSGAVTGDTVFAIPGSAVGVPVAGLEVVPAGSIPFAFSIDILGSDLLVSDAAGGGLGTVVAIDLTGIPPTLSTFASGFDYTGGVKVDGSRVLVSEAFDPTFDAGIHSYSTGGAFQGTLSGPTYDHGSVDLDVASDGGILVTGLPTLASVDGAGVATPLVTGLDGDTGFDAFGGGVSVNSFTGRTDFTASSFSGADDDRSVHRLVPIEKLEPGSGSAKTDCAMELYGIELVPSSPGRRARSAICVDGAACDADGQVDGGCTFPLGICFNVPDPTLPDCSVTGIASVELRRAKPESTEMIDLVDAASALLPSADSVCVFSDGIRVPLRELSGGDQRAGKGYVKLRAITDEARSRKDNDVAKLVCEPAP